MYDHPISLDASHRIIGIHGPITRETIGPILARWRDTLNDYDQSLTWFISHGSPDPTRTTFTDSEGHLVPFTLYVYID